MSHLSKNELFDIVTQAISDSGWEARVLGRIHPFQFLISRDEVTENIRVYIWNITHGGGSARAADEYRIQLTGVDGIETGARYRTLLLGWDMRHRVFAGWNASRYETFGASPSLQVRDGILRSASQQGLAIQPKETDAQGNVTEVVVAFRPDFFGVYAENLDNYHQPRLSRREAVLLERVATPRPPTDEELALLSEERRHVIRQIQQAVRNGRFRRIVIEAYNYRCAICGLDLGIIHAAHIIPVEEVGTDEADNGIALCPNHHAAFDRDIIIIRDNYTIVLNHRRTAELPRLLSGIQNITVPQDTRLQPRPEYLRQRIRSRNLTVPLQ
jgi:putative restriction endonuclease